MNEYLAQLYGTGEGYTEEDLEKVAAYDLLTKLAEEEGIDVNELDDETVEGLMGELMDDGSAADDIETDAEGNALYAQDDDGNVYGLADDGNYYPLEMFEQEDGGLSEEEKLAAAQLDEADFAGRVMAHAFHQESEAIEMAKEASKGRAAKALAKLPRGLRQGITGWESAGRGGQKMGLSAGQRAKRLAPYAAGVAGLGAAGAGGAYALKKGKEKRAFEEAAEERALEILADNGIDPEQDYWDSLAQYAVDNYDVDLEDLGDEEWDYLAGEMEKEAGMRPDVIRARYTEPKKGKPSRLKKNVKGMSGSVEGGGVKGGFGGRGTVSPQQAGAFKRKAVAATKGTAKRTTSQAAKREAAIAKAVKPWKPGLAHRAKMLAKTRGGKAALIGAGLAGAGGLGYGAYRMSKKASVEDMIEERAYEMLEEAGYLE